MKAWLRAFLFGVLTAVWVPVNASMVLTIDFDGMTSDPTSEAEYGPFYDEGFRIYSRVLPALIPNPEYAYYQGHLDIYCGLMGECGPIDGVPNYDGSRWLGTDAGGPARFFDADMNLLFTAGMTQGIVRIDRNGALFSALDLLVVQGGFTLTSSKGGVLFGTPNNAQLPFVSDLWQGIEWIDMTVLPPVSPVGAPLGFDNLRLEVPEPSQALLLALAMLSLGVAVWSRPARR